MPFRAPWRGRRFDAPAAIDPMRLEASELLDLAARTPPEIVRGWLVAERNGRNRRPVVTGLTRLLEAQ